MDENTFESALNLATKLQISDIRLTGGEPTNHPNFIEISERISHRNINMGLISNGVRLFKSSKYFSTLKMFQRVWISVYSVNSNKHIKIAGTGALPLDSMLKLVALISKEVNYSGISCLLNPGDVDEVESFLELCLNAGVRRVRFIPCEPDGRAKNLLHNANISDFARECQSIYNILKKFKRGGEFDYLSINDPFDSNSNFLKKTNDSCLLNDRIMASVTPNGSIYNCCFNAYEKSQLIGNCNDIVAKSNGLKLTIKTGCSNCKGLNKSYWPNINKQPICPIRILKIIENYD